MEKVALLGIDLQNDFVLQSGALSVVGAEDDANRIASFIRKNLTKIQHLSFTLDSHHPIHIASQCFWKDKDGNHPKPFTNITSSEAQRGEWIPQYNPKWAYTYLEELEKTGTQCTIWNSHCVLGTNGWALVDTVTDAIKEWEIENARPYNLWFKGTNWYTEHYSIFKANVPYPNAPETGLNQELLRVLNQYDKVLLVGEAADFCVANSLNDILNETPDLAKKLIILDDCMSWIIPNNPIAVGIFNRAKTMGATFAKSVDINI